MTNQILLKAFTVAVLMAPLCPGLINPGNVRPGVTPAASSDVYVPGVDGPASANLQDILNYIYGCQGCVNATNDQSTASMWGPTALTSLVPSLVVEFSGNTNLEFGLWFGLNPSALQFVPIFHGGATGINNGSFTSAAILKWSKSGTEMVVSGDPAEVVNGKYTIPNTIFGFYISDGSGQRRFSDDELNGGAVQMLAYLSGNSPESAGVWTLAFEDTDFAAGDRDFNDFVVTIGSMAAVPEPASVLLMGSALLVMARFIRRRV